MTNMLLIILNIGYGVVSDNRLSTNVNRLPTYELHCNHKDCLESEPSAAMDEEVLERGT